MVSLLFKGVTPWTLEMVWQYVLNRKQFGGLLARNQLVQKKLADIVMEITLGLHACLHLGCLKNKGRAAPKIVSTLKQNSCRKVLYMAKDAQNMLGDNRICNKFHMIQHFVNLEAVNTHEGTPDIHTPSPASRPLPRQRGYSGDTSVQARQGHSGTSGTGGDQVCSSWEEM